MGSRVGAVEIRIDPTLFENVERRCQDALVATGLAVINDILQARVIPKATGIMESTLQPLDVSDLDQGVVRIGSYTPYARRLYHHPEYNFHREPWEGGEGNANAQAYWFEPWISGEKSEWVRATFKRYLELTR